MKCILCHSVNTYIKESILRADISALYARAFHIDVSNIITQDIDYYHCKDCDILFFALKDGTIPTGDNNFYNTLNALDWYYFSEKHEYHYVAKYIPTDSSVLEVGCGKGAFAHFIPQAQSYVGLEFSTQAKEMAARDNICIENISIEEYAKSTPHSFDVACSFQVLEHVSNPYEFLSSQIKCLKHHNTLQNGVGGGDSLPRI